MTWSGNEPYPFLMVAARGEKPKISWMTRARFLTSPLLVIAWWRIVVEMLLSIVILVVAIRRLLRMLLRTESHWFPRHIRKTALISCWLGTRKEGLTELNFSSLRMPLFSGVTCRGDDRALIWWLLARWDIFVFRLWIFWQQMILRRCISEDMCNEGAWNIVQTTRTRTEPRNEVRPRWETHFFFLEFRLRLFHDNERNEIKLFDFSK